jgi:hypothetical protein
LGALTGAAAGDSLTDPDEDEKEDMVQSHNHKHPMRQMMDKMEEDPVFDNTPEDPTKPPAFDSDKFAHDPNRGDHRERQAGLSRAKPMEAHVESLFSEYEKFIAEAKKCNHSAEGKKCPVHGVKECSGMYEVTEPKDLPKKGNKMGKEGNAYGNAVKNTPDGEEIKINGKGTGDIKREGAVEESGLQYFTGVKKHGEKYMKAAAAAGRAGASQEELGALKDRLSKAHKGKAKEAAK